MEDTGLVDGRRSPPDVSDCWLDWPQPNTMCPARPRKCRVTPAPALRRRLVQRRQRRLPSPSLRRPLSARPRRLPAELPETQVRFLGSKSVILQLLSFLVFPGNSDLHCFKSGHFFDWPHSAVILLMCGLHRAPYRPIHVPCQRLFRRRYSSTVSRERTQRPGKK